MATNVKTVQCYIIEEELLHNVLIVNCIHLDSVEVFTIAKEHHNVLL